MSLYTFRTIFAAAAAAMLFAPFIVRLTRRLNILDQPRRKAHKQHSTPTPIAGGLLLVFTMGLLASLQRLWEAPEILALLLASSIVFGFGLWDDLFDLPVWIKLSGQLLAALVLMSGVGAPGELSSRAGVQVLLFEQNWLNQLVTLVWLVGITNAYNFVDSMDGLAVGLAALAAAFFMLVTYDAGQARLSLLSAALLGACLASYYYNSPPAYFFMGDSGAQTLGFLLAGLAIAYNPPGFEKLASWYVPILLMAVPIFDLTLVVISRLRRGLPIYQAGLDHTYHRLISLGFDSSRAVLTMHIASLLLGCIAFIALGLPPLPANAIFLLLTGAGAALLVYLEKNTPPPMP